MADEKVSDLPVLTVVDPTTDIVYIAEDDGAGGFLSKQVKVDKLLASKLGPNDNIEGGTF